VIALKSTLTFSPAENALDSMSRIARELKEKSTADVSALKSALVWGWHVVDILTYLRLLPDRANFDPWMQDYLHLGEPSLNVDRDALWDERRHLSLIEILDILSERDLAILKPEFYQGWQDRTSRCRDLRSHVASLIGANINSEQRGNLLYLLSVYNRLFHLPVGVSLDTTVIREKLPALLDLIELLLHDDIAAAASLRQIVAKCRNLLSGN
jgi:hypothetical protein